MPTLPTPTPQPRGNPARKDQVSGQGFFCRQLLPRQFGLLVRGHAHGGEVEGLDEAFDYQGPKHKLEVVLLVPSAEQAYEELLFREKNIPGGLRSDPDGALVFETHDPDGVKIILRQPT